MDSQTLLLVETGILATASFDKTVKVWNVATHQLLVTFTGYTAPVNSVAFSLDGRTLAITSAGHSARLGDSDVERVTELVCRIVGTVSPSQWVQRIPDLPYQPTCC